MAWKPSATAAALLLGAALLAAAVCALAQTTPPGMENDRVERCFDAAFDYVSGISALGTLQAAVRGLTPVEVARCVCRSVAGSIGIVDDTPEGVAAVFEAVLRELNLAVPRGFVCEPVGL